MANIFKEAKKIQRMHKTWDWQKCIQVASSRHKKVGSHKKKKYRQTGTSDKMRDSMIKAKSPGKRKGYTERRKNRSDMPGSMTGLQRATAPQLRSELKDRLKDSLGKQLVRKELASTKREKNKIQKTIVSTRSQLKKLL